MLELVTCETAMPESHPVGAEGRGSVDAAAHEDRCDALGANKEIQVARLCFPRCRASARFSVRVLLQHLASDFV